MKSRKLCRFAVALAAASWLVAMTAAAQPGGAVYVRSIRVEGNAAVSRQKILRVLRVAPGDALDPSKVQDGLKRLFATKQFSDIQAWSQSEASPDSVLLVLQVKEYPKIDELRIEGNHHVDKDDITKAVEVGKGTFVRPALLEKDVEAISNLYRDKGYYQVAVHDSTFFDQKTGNRVMVYQIAEGQKVSVQHLDFFGSRDIDTDDIRHVIKTKPGALFRGGDFKPKQFDKDKNNIVDLYKSRGFLDAAIVDTSLVFSDEGKHLDIFITIKEGKRYYVGRVTWKGNELFPDTTIARKVTLKRGQPFNDIELSHIQLAIGNLYWDKGYIYSNVAPIKTVRGDTVDVRLDIEQGSLAHIHEIDIVGNTKTAENVIRRELTIAPGDVFAANRLRRSLREVFNLGFFSGPPQVSTNPAGEQGDIDVTLRVNEKPAGQFRMGAGFSQLNKVSGFIGISEPNFLGKALNVGFDWEFSKYAQNFSISYTDPWFMNTPTQLGLSVFNRVQNQVSQQFFTDRRRGASIQVGRPFPWFDYTTIYTNYRFEEVALSDFATGYTGTLRDINWPQKTSAVGLTLVRNSTDNPFHPTQGTRTSLRSRWTGGNLLGGDVAFQRYETDFAWYQLLLWKFVLEVRNETGILAGYNNPGQVPDYELYRLGGNRTYGLRGYDFYEVVPRGNAQYIGGHFMDILSYEVSFPIAPPTVYGLFFLDSGNTWNSFREANLADLRKGAGLGIRIELPMLGTIGMDYGYGFDRAGGGRWQPHITFGGAGF